MYYYAVDMGRFFFVSRILLHAIPFFFMYCWSKVYELFCYISLMTDPLVSSVSPFCELHPPPPYCLPHPGLRQLSEEQSHEEEEQEQGLGGTEFYPVDPLSRGMMDRLVALNRNMHGSTYVPFHNDDDYVSQVKDYDKFTVNFSVYYQFYYRAKGNISWKTIQPFVSYSLKNTSPFLSFFP